MKNYVLIFLTILCGCSIPKPLSVLAPTNAMPATIRSVVAPPLPPMPVVGVVSHDTLAITHISPFPPMAQKPFSGFVTNLIQWDGFLSTSAYYIPMESHDGVTWSNCGVIYCGWTNITLTYCETNTQTMSLFKIQLYDLYCNGGWGNLPENLIFQ